MSATTRARTGSQVSIQLLGVREGLHRPPSAPSWTNPLNDKGEQRRLLGDEVPHSHHLAPEAERKELVALQHLVASAAMSRLSQLEFVITVDGKKREVKLDQKTRSRIIRMITSEAQALANTGVPAMTQLEFDSLSTRDRTVHLLALEVERDREGFCLDESGNVRLDIPGISESVVHYAVEHGLTQQFGIAGADHAVESSVGAVKPGGTFSAERSTAHHHMNSADLALDPGAQSLMPAPANDAATPAATSNAGTA